MSASDKQHGGGHYAKLPTEMQPWNVLQHWLTPEEYRGWQKGVAIVYLARERDKGGDLDIQKAAHHLERLIEEFPPRVDAPAATPARAEELQADDGWIEWGGGLCPVNRDVMIEYKLRNGASDTHRRAGSVEWDHMPACDSGDVIAYRVVKV